MTTLQMWRVRPLARFPHGTDLFTQGLMIHDAGLVLESVGLYGQSRLIYRSRRDLSPVASHVLDPDLFAEGICPGPAGRIMVMTWKESAILQWHVGHGTVERIHPYDQDREGWGIAYTGLHYLTTDGSSTLTRRDRDLTAIERVDVQLAGEPLAGLNALTWSDHETLWANIYGMDYLAEIHPRSGTVGALIDATALRATEGPGSEVLNGICQYTPDSLLLTGKRWNWIYQVALEPVAWSPPQLEPLLQQMPRLYQPSQQRLLRRRTFHQHRRDDDPKAG